MRQKKYKQQTRKKNKAQVVMSLQGTCKCLSRSSIILTSKSSSKSPNTGFVPPPKFRFLFVSAADESLVMIFLHLRTILSSTEYFLAASRLLVSSACFITACLNLKS